MRISRIHSLFLGLLCFLGLLSSITLYAQDNDAPEPISQAEIEQLLAPIALYPDTILSHILIAATFPLEIVQAERWSTDNDQPQGQAATEAVDDYDWDPSVKALVAFPAVLQRMSQDLEWTQALGDAFLQDEERVLAAVQELRHLAQAEGSLDKMDKVTVIKERETIILEPRHRHVVYLPYYDTRHVYGAWRWHHHQPYFWDYPYAHEAHYYDRFYWGPSVSLSFVFFSNTVHWRNRHIVRVAPSYYRPHRYYHHNDIIGHRYARHWSDQVDRRHTNYHRQWRDRNFVDQREAHHQPRQVSRPAHVSERLEQRREEYRPTPSPRQVDMSRARIVQNQEVNRAPSTWRQTQAPATQARPMPSQPRVVSTPAPAPSRATTTRPVAVIPAPQPAAQAPRPAPQVQVNRSVQHERAPAPQRAQPAPNNRPNLRQDR